MNDIIVLNEHRDSFVLSVRLRLKWKAKANVHTVGFEA